MVSSVSDPLLGAVQVYEAIGISRPTFYRWIREGRFPPGIQVGPATVRWHRSTVESWLEDLATNKGSS